MLNIVGEKYGRLTVIEEAERCGKYARRFKCLCDCGNITIAHQSSLRNGTTKSCGCIRKESTAKTFSKGENRIVLHDDYAEVILLNIEGIEVGRAIIDIDDIDIIKKYHWHLSGKYAFSTKDKLYMHKLLCESGDKVDHKDRKTLNNRRSNLRPANNQQNAMNQGLRKNNKSGIKGVSWNKEKGKWDAEITKNGIKYRLGRYKNKEDAINIRRNAERRLFGEFAAIF